MQALLRFAGILNAAIWLGAGIAVSFVVLPVLFTPAVTPGLMPKFHAGRLAELVLNRYLVLQLVCATVALLHLYAERRQTGRPADRKSVSLLVGLLTLAAFGTFWLAPKMERLHLEKYAVNRTAEQQAAASRQFAGWHGVSQAANLVMLAGVLFHFWKTAKVPSSARSVPLPRQGL
jgi:hypothetical protein